MNNIEKLETIGILGDIRQRLGAKDEDDTSRDDKINSMTNSELISKWCGWHLGSEGWWFEMKGHFDNLEELDN